jgi:SPP1 family predicted phage head-tail adaptor
MLRHRITLQEKDRTGDGGGGHDVDWVVVARPYAYIKELSGYEKFVSQQRQSEVTHDITIRYRSGVTAGMRIEYRAKTYNIQAVLNIEERDVWLILKCIEGMAT